VKSAKILKGTRRAHLSIERSTKFELLINSARFGTTGWDFARASRLPLGHCTAAGNVTFAQLYTERGVAHEFAGGTMETNFGAAAIRSVICGACAVSPCPSAYLLVALGVKKLR
jgi:hypothetical protein